MPADSSAGEEDGSRIGSCPGVRAGGSAFDVPSMAGAWGPASSHLSFSLDHISETPPQHSRACRLASSLTVAVTWQQQHPKK